MEGLYFLFFLFFGRRRKCRNVVAWNWHSTKVTTSKQKWPTSRFGAGRNGRKVKATLGNRAAGQLDSWTTGQLDNWSTGKQMTLHVSHVHEHNRDIKDMNICRIWQRPWCHEKCCNHKLCNRDKKKIKIKEKHRAQHVTTKAMTNCTFPVYLSFSICSKRKAK